MTAQRIITAILLAVIGLPLIIWGGWGYELLILLLLALSAWEMGRMFTASGSQPARIWLISGAFVLPWVYVHAPQWALHVITAWMLFIMVHHLAAYEKGRDQAATDFAATIGGLAYLSLLGIYLLLLRALPDGLWWFMLALPIVWIADSGAYFIGRRWGRHKLSPRLSPKKTWEGYLGGIVTGLLASLLLTWAYISFGKVDISLWQGAMLGLALPVLTPLGDLAESLFKRQAGIKDSSHIFPGHGGAFDRIDSWLWAAYIGYLLIQIF